MSGAEIILRVTPEVLAARADDAARKINEMDTCLKEISRVVYSTKGYWIGEAGDACRRQYEKEQDVVDQLTARLKEQPQKLLSIAGVYTKKEQEAENVSTPLPGNVID